jgi:DNA repair protein RAD57
MSPKADPLSALSFAPIDPLYPNTLLYTPDKSQAQPQSCSPQDKAGVKVIILATWLGGASAGRIAVYCRGYQAAYPTASVLLLRTVLSDITVKTFAVVQAQLEPARKFLLSAFTPGIPQTEGGALFHMFSNGGCNTAVQLSRLLRGNNPAAPFPIPLIGVILDSCPGATNFGKAYSGAVYSLPATQIPGVNLLGRAVIFPVIGAIYLLQKSGMLSSAEDLRAELNDLNTFGRVSRLYLHSKGDRLVSAEDVASHAAEIGARVPVVRELWEVAGHVALPVEDSGRYWSAVECFVDGSKRTREAKL